jgi:hypothetical protein
VRVLVSVDKSRDRPPIFSAIGLYPIRLFVSVAGPLSGKNWLSVVFYTATKIMILLVSLKTVELNS